MSEVEFDFSVVSSRKLERKPTFDEDDFASLGFKELNVKKKKVKKTKNKEKAAQVIPNRRSSLPSLCIPKEPEGPPPGWVGEAPGKVKERRISERMRKLNNDTSIVEDLRINDAWGTITPRARKFTDGGQVGVSGKGSGMPSWNEEDELASPRGQGDLLDGDIIEERVDQIQRRHRRSSLPLNPLTVEKHSKKDVYSQVDEELSELKEDSSIPENIRRLIVESNMGWTESQFTLAYCYDTGSGGVVANTEKAIHWYTEAAQNGHITAQNNLGVLLATGHRKRIKPNPAEAFVWYKKAAENGHPNAEFHMGLAFLKGDGLEAKDLTESFRWFKKAAKQGHVLAQANVGAMYMSKQGVPQDFKKAKKWLLKAAQHGSAIAHHNLAVMYSQGYGVVPDKVKMDHHLKSSMEGPNKGAIPKKLSEQTLKSGNTLMNM